MRMRGRRWRANVHGAHQAAVRVIEDVAVEHPLAGPLVEASRASAPSVFIGMFRVSFHAIGRSGCALFVHAA